MQAFISADMEGVTGVAAPADVAKEEPEYERGVDLLHGDVNAAVEGAFDAGADDVVVNDSHATMRNLDRARLDDRSTLIRGSTKPRSMAHGLTPDRDVALFVGYHAMAGTPGAVLNHTFLGHALVRLAVNGTAVGELGWNARFAGAMEVPVGLVTGDDATAAEADDEVPEAETVVVKEGIDRFSAACRSGAETRPEIREAAERAVDRARSGDLALASATEPVTTTATWATTNQAAKAAGSAAVTRTGGRETSVTGDDYVTTFEDAVAMLRAGAAGQDQYYG